MGNKILVIEDDNFLQKAIKTALTSEGYKVKQLLSGKDAQKAISDEKPDLILLDLLLPEKSGYKVLVEAKKDKKTKKIPVVVMSVIDTKTSIEECKSYGADDYLVKSNYSLEEMIEKIKKHLKNASNSK